MDNFAVKRAELGRSVFVTERQEQWVQAHTRLQGVLEGSMSKRKVSPVRFRTQRAARWLLAQPWWDLFFSGLIFFNLAILAAYSPQLPRRSLDAMNIVNLTLSFVFFFECVVRCVGVGLSAFCHDRMNVFDVGVIVTMIATDVADVEVGANSLRALRVARLLRLFRSTSSLHALFEVMFESIPVLLNVGGLTFLTFYVCAPLTVLHLIAYSCSLPVKAI